MTLDRDRYVYEGPHGTPRSRRDVSPDAKLRVPIANKLTSALRELRDAPILYRVPYGCASDFEIPMPSGDV